MSTFEEIKENCLQNDELFEDPEFPPSIRSLFFTKNDRSIEWKRPKEICDDPMFISGNVSQFDLNQGNIGNCWYIAAAAVLATHRNLYAQVVPDDQEFDDRYAGIFRFHFWNYGQWIEVIIDDYLPTQGGQLIYCHNLTQPNEFWSALMEKAYAKMYGCYEALVGGIIEDALVDFTGGIGSRVDLTDKANLPANLYDDLFKWDRMNTLMGCGIMATSSTMENVKPNGLVLGHAYSITKVQPVKVRNQVYRLLRLRNPWGQNEWNGPWSDKSKQWTQLSDQERKQLGVVFDDDGEFWIPYEDWVDNFHQLQLCHLPPGAPRRKVHNEWSMYQLEGSWVNGVNAGGCGNPPYRDEYWTNPQYIVEVGPQSDNQCKVIVSLLQKQNVEQMKYTNAEVPYQPMSIDLFQVRDPSRGPPKRNNYSRQDLQVVKRGDKYQNYREITHKYDIPPGTYVIIPSTFDPGAEAEYLLRFIADVDNSKWNVEPVQ